MYVYILAVHRMRILTFTGRRLFQLSLQYTHRYLCEIEGTSTSLGRCEGCEIFWNESYGENFNLHLYRRHLPQSVPVQLLGCACDKQYIQGKCEHNDIAKDI